MIEIKNKVAESGLITLDLKDYRVKGERVFYDLKQHLFQELVLIEKEFRAFIAAHDWSVYQGKYVAMGCSVEAIIPSWAYLLLATAIAPHAQKVVQGTLEDLELLIFEEQINQLNVHIYTNQRIIVKGCADVYIPTQAYVRLIEKLQPIAKSIMYGEACSTVPLFKRKEGA